MRVCKWLAAFCGGAQVRRRFSGVLIIVRLPLTVRLNVSWVMLLWSNEWDSTTLVAPAANLGRFWYLVGPQAALL